MRTVHVYRGYHGQGFERLFDACWERGELLIVCPPTELDPSWRPALERAGEFPEEPVLGVFTTGTTRSTQKLVLYSRANIAASQDAILALFDTGRIEAVFCYPQPYHVFGLLLGYVLARRHGFRRLCPEGPYDRNAHRRWLEAASPSLMTLATPSHMHDLCAWLEQTGTKPPPSYSCILGGAKVSRETWLRARDVARIEQPSIGYGCTEASPGICHLPPGIEPLGDGDVGWPLRDVTLGACPTGFLMRGPSVCLATIEDGVVSFSRELLVRDELAALGDGRLAFTGRTDMVLNRGGEKFALESIEALLKARHGIDAICTALPDPRLGAELGIVARAGREVCADAIFSTLTTAYGRRFNRAHLRIVAELPQDLNAKPDRKRARQLLLDGSEPSRPTAPIG